MTVLRVSTDEPAGHVVTGDLNIIRDAKLRSLVEKGPSFRKQNSINWKIYVDKLWQNIKVNGQRKKE